MSLLSIIVFLPLAGALLTMCIPPEEEGIARFVGFVVALATFGVSLVLLPGFDPAQSGFQFETKLPWTPSLGIGYHIGIDGISLWLVLLTTFLMPVTLLSAQRAISRRTRDFVVAMLILETGMLGTFVALDLFLFYVFWEVMLVPMYLLIGIWGGERRVYASIKFVLYTMLGSLLMLVAIVYLAMEHRQVQGTLSFDYADLGRLVLPKMAQLYCFLAFGLAFAIKVPLWPLHTWLPDAHVEAPTAGSVILAGVLLKFGIYGFLRFAMPFFPWATERCAPYLALAALIGIIYGSLVAWAQTDVKKLIAYSSVAHLALVMLGVLAWSPRAISGAIFVMLAHGLYSGGLFLAVGVLYERRHTRRLDEFGGIWKRMPIYGACFLILTLASIGLPGLVGFVGEFLVLSGTFEAYHFWQAHDLPLHFSHAKIFAGLATTSVILGAVYMLWMFQKVMFGPLDNPRNRELRDLSFREALVFAPVLFLIFAMGLRPAPFLTRMDASVARLMTEYHQKLLASHKPGLPKLLPSGNEADRPQDDQGSAVSPRKEREDGMAIDRLLPGKGNRS